MAIVVQGEVRREVRAHRPLTRARSGSRLREGGYEHGSAPDSF
jgi:hypothetical protein